MTNRLHYETSAGSLSPTHTFEQLIEYLRLAEEDARRLSNFAKMRGDTTKALAWSRFGNNFSQIQDIITQLAQGESKGKAGYTSSLEYGNG